MKTGHWPRDRRQEHRSSAAGRITWNHVGDSVRESSLLSDRSVSGISFVTASRSEPMVGDMLRITSPDGSGRHWRVVRISDYDASFSVIACRAMSGAAIPASNLRRASL